MHANPLKPWLFGAVLLFAGCAASPGAPDGVVGGDDRRVVAQADRRFDAVGLLRLGADGGGFCTGALVAPDLVATAAHCLWDPVAGAWLEPEEVSFSAGYRRGERAGRAEAAALRLPAGVAVGPDGTTVRPGDDRAILVLARPVRGVRPLRLAGSEDLAGLGEGRLLRAGYSADRPNLPTAVEGCSVLGATAEGRLLLHDCDAGPGDSGSALLTEQGGELALVGVQSLMATRGETSVGAAVRVTAADLQPSRLSTSAALNGESAVETSTAVAHSASARR